MPGLDEPAAPLPGPRISAVRQFAVEKGGIVAARVLIGELHGHLTRLGVPRLRALTPVFAGEVKAQIAHIGEYPGFVAYGEVTQRAQEDTEFQAFLRDRMGASSSPVTLVHTHLRTELPLP